MKKICFLFCLLYSISPIQCMIPEDTGITDTVVLETIGALVGSAAFFVGIACCCMKKIFNQDTNNQEEQELLVTKSRDEASKGAGVPGKKVPGKKEVDADTIANIE